MSDLRDRFDETDTELTEKPHYAVWWHQVAAWVMYGVFGMLRRHSSFEGDFDRDYFTTLGRHVYTPAGRDVSYDDEPETRAILAHELAHRYQDERRGWWGHRLPYVLSRTYRARAELEACGIQMAAYHRREGMLPDELIDSMATNVSSAAYLGAIDEPTARRYLEALADDVRAGRIRGFDPTASPPIQSRFETDLGE